MLLVKLGRKYAEFRGAGPSYHGLVLVTQLNELFPQFLFVLTGALITTGEQLTAALPGWKPFSTGQLEHHTTNIYILYLGVAELCGNFIQ